MVSVENHKGELPAKPSGSDATLASSRDTCTSSGTVGCHSEPCHGLNELFARRLIMTCSAVAWSKSSELETHYQKPTQRPVV